MQSVFDLNPQDVRVKYRIAREAYEVDLLWLLRGIGRRLSVQVEAILKIQTKKYWSSSIYNSGK